MEAIKTMEDDLENDDSFLPPSGELKPNSTYSDDDDHEDSRDDSYYFEKEVEATFLRVVHENIQESHLILEINSLKLSYNKLAADCAGVVFSAMMKDHNPFQLSGEDKTTINPQPSTFFFLDYHHPSSLITSRHRSFFIVRPRLPSLIVRKLGLRMVDIEVQTQSQVIQADSEAKASVQPPSDEDNEQSDKDSWHSEELKSPISTYDEDDEKAVFPIFNPNSTFGQVHLEMGMEFENLDLFKDALRDYTIHLGREFVWKKNDRERVRAKCKEQESKKKWISKKLEAKIRQQPTITYIQAFDYLKEEFGVQINDTKLFRSLKEARQLVEGDVNQQYAKIWDYAHELLRSNPGSTTKIDCIPIPNAPPQFQRFYGYYGGKLLAAVGQDANNHNYCIAYAIVDAENKDNWRWFLTLLRQDLGDCRQHGWNFMSDMQKGLIAAVHEVFPNAPHRYCAMHLWRNFIKQYKDLELRGVVWKCARATTPAQFNAVMERLKVKNEKAWRYLGKWPKEAWTKAYFSTECKTDNITNNVCEGFNASILKYRAKPILSLAEEIRCYIMRTMSSNKLKLLNRQGPLCPIQHSRLDKLKIESMPCEHAIACIAHQVRKPEDFCQGWLTMGSYNATYEHFIKPTQGEEYWEPTSYDRPTPAPIKRRPGRPKKQRRKDTTENPSQTTKLKRSYPIITCQRCGHQGHNTNGCCYPGVSRRPPNWIPPPPDEDVTPLMVSCPMPSSQLVMMTFMPTPRLPPSEHGQNQG
ncbi:hypothetical protein D0Y65_030320 [Glycine soja]|uniref:MULE transposase domain-containing protein n=1 Tax=Glycine soja TaxID=3848 RepID=A0A445I3V6_GLYSO|nr:hypothetical protein D0Y65_030320 [Glycine soja]